MTATRRLTAILAADVAGYSRLIGADEGGTLDSLRAIRAELIDPMIATHHGRLVKTTGDGLLVEFGSVVDALRCGSELQRDKGKRNATVPPDRRIEYRIGIHQGDIVVEDGDIFGDGVNIAARLEGLAEPGDICVSGRVQEDAAGKLDLTFEDIGEQQLKNITRPVRVYRIAIKHRLAPQWGLRHCHFQTSRLWGGVYNCTRAFLPMLPKADAGHIVNTSSVNGFWASVGPRIPHTAYSAAKFAVKGFTEALITDLRINAPHIKCSVIMPLPHWNFDSCQFAQDPERQSVGRNGGDADCSGTGAHRLDGPRCFKFIGR